MESSASLGMAAGPVHQTHDDLRWRRNGYIVGVSR